MISKEIYCNRGGLSILGQGAANGKCDMSYIVMSLTRMGWGRTILKADLIVREVYHASLVVALRHVHIARRSHFKVR